MNIKEFYKELSHVNATRESRLHYANLVLNDKQLFINLLEIMFMVNDHVSCKAAWVFEFVCYKNIALLTPHLAFFTKNIHNIHLDSALRPVAKVCMLIANTYYSQEPNSIKQALTKQQKEIIIETGFDWMIGKQKVATKAFTMETLFLFGKETNWVHQELAQLLQQDFYNQSAGFKAKAKQILNKIKKTKKLE